MFRVYRNRLPPTIQIAGGGIPSVYTVGVAAIEIVVVKAVERSLVIIIERLVDKVKLGTG